MHNALPIAVRDALTSDRYLSLTEITALSKSLTLRELMQISRQITDINFPDYITYSPKVFVPLTRLCRDVCHYCTFATSPSHLNNLYMPIDEVIELCHRGSELGCREALFTLGEKPEYRYSKARAALKKLGFATTLEYVTEAAKRVLEETGLLPHINAGCMSSAEIDQLREVSASMGIMLESSSERLCQKGMPHYGSPDKMPERRLRTIELAGIAKVPFTSGILIGIGETRSERIESLFALLAEHRKFGHLQEIIIQNFRAKPDTLMRNSPEPNLDELLWTIAVSRLIFGPKMSIQVPPNLNPGVLNRLVSAGINDWGGVSPLTPDHVNPEAPWPHLEQLRAETKSSGKSLEERLTVYPEYFRRLDHWIHPKVRSYVLTHADSQGLARGDAWTAGTSSFTPKSISAYNSLTPRKVSKTVLDAVACCEAGRRPTDQQLRTLFDVRGDEFKFVLQAADNMRRLVVGDQVTFVVNRNINYTNVCTFGCLFCAFSKGGKKSVSTERAYDIPGEELARRSKEAWQRGATEVCLQGGIHPDYTGETYRDIVSTVRKAVPDMHIHAFSPLEIMHGAKSMNLSIADFLFMLKEVGLNTLPGTAAEVLHKEVRSILCPDKLTSEEWLEVMKIAHKIGLRSTATIMFGHVDSSKHWAAHLLKVRDLQAETGGFTEFVPLPFVAAEAPAFYRGLVRKGPTWREALLMHAVPRLAFYGKIDNIQVSWVKMGQAGAAACLNAGANDLGGTLMNESITRSAGAKHGQEWQVGDLESVIKTAERVPSQRTTLYKAASPERVRASREAIELLPIVNEPANKKAMSKLITPFRNGAESFLELNSQQVFLMAASN